MFNRADSIFAGMSNAQLQAALTSAQAGLVALTAGDKRASISYTQGESTKAATFTKAEMGNLSAMIRELQWMLGIVATPRQRPARFVFR
jgi:hypothetical protein